MAAEKITRVSLMVPAGSTVKTTSLGGSALPSLDDSLFGDEGLFGAVFGRRQPHQHRQTESKSNRMMMVTFEVPEAELPAMRKAARKLLEDLT